MEQVIFTVLSRIFMYRKMMQRGGTTIKNMLSNTTKKSREKR